MATTFRRINLILENANKRTSWDSKDELSETIRHKKLYEFKVKGDGTDQEDFMKTKTISRLIDLIVDLDFIENIDDTPGIRITERGVKSLKSTDDYKLQLKSSLKSHLDRKKISISEINDTIKKIQLPDVPDIATIYAKLPDSKRITEKELRTLMFMYALAEGIKRNTKVIYVI